jgi:hypothetical protein
MKPGPSAGTSAKANERENQFKAGLNRVHSRFVAFVIVGIACLALCYPRWGDQARVEALRDLAQLQSEARIPDLRGQLAQKAEKALSFDLERVARAVALPLLVARPGTEPQAHLFTAEPPALATVGELQDLGQSGARFPVYGPSPDALADSLRWRLHKVESDAPLVLTRLELSDPVAQNAIDTEVAVEPARVEALQAIATCDQSFDVYTAKREHLDALKKRRVPKPVLQEAIKERGALYEAFAENKRTMLRAKATYDRLMKTARRRPEAAVSQAERGRLVVVTLERTGAKPLELTIPMARPARFAVTPPFTVSAALSRLRDNPRWAELKGLDARKATERLEQQVSFHLWSGEVAGVSISGLSLLKFLPLVFALALWMLTRACRRVRNVYSPLGSNQGTPLPTPGTGMRDLDRALLIGLPVAVCGLSCWSLWRLDAELFMTAILSAVLITQGFVAVRLWKEIHRLLSIARQRSLVQPLPERLPSSGSVARLQRTGSGQ